jgi:hypothetical protein
LADRFSDHFRLKITNIRSNLEAARSLHLAADVPIDAPTFSSFESVSVPEMVALIKVCSSKSSTRDPIPTSLLKRFADNLAIPIIAIVNSSLSSGIFPDDMKLAYRKKHVARQISTSVLPRSENTYLALLLHNSSPHLSWRKSTTAIHC